MTNLIEQDIEAIEQDIAANLPFAEERRQLITRLKEIDKIQMDEIDRRLAELEKNNGK